MKTITINLYTLDELSPEAKKKAMESLYDINVRYEWWDGVYQDANNAGIKIKGFQTGRGGEVSLQMVANPMVTARYILNNWGEDTEGFTCSKKYLDDELLPEYEDALMDVYLVMLENEYEYLLSDYAIEENVLANEYLFTEDGMEYKH